MGDCFSISLNITLKNEAAAVRVMQEYIQNKPYVNFGLEENQKRGIGTDNFNDLIRIFFSSCNGTVIDVARNEDIISYNADFDATYSWKSVMLDIFGSIAPFLEDGSELNIGHIVLADEMILEKVFLAKQEGHPYPSEKVSMLRHMILSHHGTTEWGSPVAPAILEAEVLHQIDYMDSRLIQYTDAYNKLEAGEMSERIYGLGSSVVRPGFYKNS